VNTNKIHPEQMTIDFFDYVFLGKGLPKNEIWRTIQDDVNYWYPVDINLGGKEHKTVHFPVFLMNHIAIMPQEMYPKGIFVHWWVTQKGKEKISKSKGGAEHVSEAAVIYGIDAMRLYYAHVGSSSVDIEWDKDVVLKYKNRIAGIFKATQNLKTIKGKKNLNIDNWLTTRLNRRICNINKFFTLYNLRDAANEIYFEIQKDLQWYLKRGGENKEILSWYIEQWIKLMTPITPHLAEELWSSDKKNVYVSNELYPRKNESQIVPVSEVGEYLLQNLIDDINEIKKVTKIKPSKINLYLAPKWKYEVFIKAIHLYEKNKLNIGNLMKELIKEPFYRNQGKDISKFVGKIQGEIKKLQDQDRQRYLVGIDEKKYLVNEKQFLEKNLKCSIEVYQAYESDDDIKKHDPENKSRFAMPLRPAIYMI
jgi:leucyl-tRNA synthetase